MKIQITKETVIENENILLTGGIGTGKSRNFIKPIISSIKEGSFILLTSDESYKDFSNNISYYDHRNISKAEFELDLQHNENIVMDYNILMDRQNYIIENNISELIDLLKVRRQEDIIVIFDGFGMFNFNCMTKNIVKQLNENNIYFIFIFQSLFQAIMNNKDLIDICSTHVIFKNTEQYTLDYYKKFIDTLDFGKEGIENKICYIYSKGKLIKNNKLDEIDTTKLKYYRIKNKLSQIELAKKSGVSLRNIREIENDINKIRKTKAMTIYKLAATLGCTVEILLEI